MGISPDELCKKGRQNKISFSKGLIAYWGYEELGMSCSEIGGYLEISRQRVNKAVRKGKVYANQNSLKLLS